MIDNRTGKSYEIPVQKNFVQAKDIFKIANPDGQGVRVYDPGYMNTINCTSKISYIDGDLGILEYRGIPIQVLAEQSSFMEVAFLLIYGELPTREQF